MLFLPRKGVGIDGGKVCVSFWCVNYTSLRTARRTIIIGAYVIRAGDPQIFL